MLKIPTKDYVDNTRYIKLGDINNCDGNDVPTKFANKILSLPIETRSKLNRTHFAGDFNHSFIYAFDLLYLDLGKGYLGAIIFSYYESEMYYVSVTDGIISTKKL